MYFMVLRTVMCVCCCGKGDIRSFGFTNVLRMIGTFVLKRIGKCSDGKNDTLE